MKIGKESKFKIIKYIFLTIIIICFSYNIIFLLNTTITQNDYMKLFGITFLNMENDLMKEEISKNNLVVVKQVKEKDLNEGNIIAYTVNGQTRINKIIKIQNGYTTKSNKNYYPDIEKIEYKDIIGKKVANIPYLGMLIKILQSPITSILIFMFLVFGFVVNKYVYRKSIERARKKKKFKN